MRVGATLDKNGSPVGGTSIEKWAQTAGHGKAATILVELDAATMQESKNAPLYALGDPTSDSDATGSGTKADEQAAAPADGTGSGGIGSSGRGGTAEQDRVGTTTERGHTGASTEKTPARGATKTDEGRRRGTSTSGGGGTLGRPDGTKTEVNYFYDPDQADKGNDDTAPEGGVVGGMVPVRVRRWGRCPLVGAARASGDPERRRHAAVPRQRELPIATARSHAARGIQHGLAVLVTRGVPRDAADRGAGLAGLGTETVGQSGHPLLGNAAAPTRRSMHQRIALITALVSIVGAAAHADPIDDLNLQLADWADRSERIASAPMAYDAKRGPEQCFKAIDDAIAAGISPTQLIESYAFRRHPKAKPVDGRDVYAITLDEARAYCATYEHHFRFAAEWATFDKANTWRDIYVNGAPLPDERKKAAHELADQCRAAWERANKAGVPDDLPTTMEIAKTFREVRGKVCDGLDKATNNLAKNISAAPEATRKKYEAAGIAGKKLELMIQYDGVYWRLPGGSRTDDPKKLAAASVLFQWLEAEDRDDPRYVVHTIRKYRFKGDKLLGTSEKTYRRKKGADVGNVFK